MTKRHIGRKEKKDILNTIRSSLLEGKAKAQIHEDLSKEYYDEDLLHGLLASSPSEEAKNNNRMLSVALIFLLYTNGIIQLLIAIILCLSAKGLSSLILLIPVTLFTPAINYYSAQQIRQSNGGMFILICLVGCMGFLSGNTSSYIMDRFANDGFDFIRYISLGLVTLIVIGIFFLKQRMFPYYGFFGPKKDSKSRPIYE